MRIESSSGAWTTARQTDKHETGTSAARARRAAAGVGLRVGETRSGNGVGLARGQAWLHLRFPSPPAALSRMQHSFCAMYIHTSCTASYICIGYIDRYKDIYRLRCYGGGGSPRDDAPEGFSSIYCPPGVTRRFSTEKWPLLVLFSCPRLRARRDRCVVTRLPFSPHRDWPPRP